MKRIGGALLWVAGVFLVARALVEPYTINFSDPSTYDDDWGGPSLLGVLIVHCGLGVLAAALMARRLMRRSSRRLHSPDDRPAPPFARWRRNRPAPPAEHGPGDRPTPPAEDDAGRSLSMAGVGTSLPWQQERQHLHQESHA